LVTLVGPYCHFTSTFTVCMQPASFARMQLKPDFENQGRQ
jgi:hypothetical protein